VADDLDAVGILVCHDAHRGVMVDDMGGVDQRAVDSARKRRLGKPRPNARRDLGDRNGPVKLLVASIGKSNYRHRFLMIPKGLLPVPAGQRQLNALQPDAPAS
jgi:hypothetical protein